MNMIMMNIQITKESNMPANIISIFQEMLISHILHPFSLLPPLILLLFIYRWILPKFSPKKNLPPSPPRLPIVGNLHQLGSLPFRSLQTLSEKYGDLMLLYLGSKPTIVVSSAEVASQVLKIHDLIFASRPYLSTIRRLLGNGKDMVSSPYGEHWRHMRSICMLHLLSSKKFRSYKKVRKEEVDLIINNIQGLKEVNLREMFMSLSNDLTCRVAFGKKYRGEDDFIKMLDAHVKLLGGFFIGDYVSWLGWIDKISGVDAMVKNVTRKFDHFLEKILHDHSIAATNKNGGGGKNQDFVDVLLEVQRNDTHHDAFLDRESIKGLLLDIFSGGTDSIAVVLEWIMSELLRNPRVLQELKKEVSRVAKDKESVTEDDLENTSYLKAVIKENLRLHSPGPLMIPHESSKDITINGYDIPAGTQVIVNVWAISRNPRYWEDPQSFYPERFLNSSIDFKGHDFEFIPFGSGRRICPGMALSIANIEFTIANLVHRFDWSLPDESLYMTESHGITMHKKTPLVVVPSTRIN